MYPDSIHEFQRAEESRERRAEAMARYRRQQFDLFEFEYPECPNCGEHAQPVSFNFGRCAETGYQDAGEGCTECINRR